MCSCAMSCNGTCKDQPITLAHFPSIGTIRCLSSDSVCKTPCWVAGHPLCNQYCGTILLSLGSWVSSVLGKDNSSIQYHPGPADPAWKTCQETMQGPQVAMRRNFIEACHPGISMHCVLHSDQAMFSLHQVSTFWDSFRFFLVVFLSGWFSLLTYQVLLIVAGGIWSWKCPSSQSNLLSCNPSHNRAAAGSHTCSRQSCVRDCCLILH